MSGPSLEPLLPDWPAPARVRGFTTTRAGGVSEGGYARLNLGARTGDRPERIAENRRRFRALLPSEPGWLRQVHGARVLHRDALRGEAEADACWTATAGLTCTVLTADCLPVLFCDRAGTVVAVAHAGWRGLAGGVLEATVRALPAPPHELLAWIGPGIGPAAYEVGADFRSAFRRRLPWLDTGFVRVSGSVHADLPAIARAVLERAGVTQVHSSGVCTFAESDRFFSHRRNPAGGRMATVIWLEAG